MKLLLSNIIFAIYAISLNAQVADNFAQVADNPAQVADDSVKNRNFAHIATPEELAKKKELAKKEAAALRKRLQAQPWNKGNKTGDDVADINIPIVKLVFAMVIMFSVMGGVFYLIKRFGRQYIGIDNAANIKILSRASLDTKNYVAVIRVYEEEMLIGVGNNGISLLSRFSPIGEDEIEANNSDNKDSIFDLEIKSQIDKSILSEDIK